MSKWLCLMSGIVMMVSVLAMEMHEKEATIVCAITGSIVIVCLIHEYLEIKRHENDIRLSWRYDSNGIWE